jgi:2-isopropylmalate synthase
MNGIGERAGNCSLEEVIMAIKVRKDIECAHRINHQEIWRTSQTVSQICNMPIPPTKLSSEPAPLPTLPVFTRTAC